MHAGYDAVHFEGVKAALSSPAVRGILAEKPLALEIAEAEELAEMARSRGVALAVNYSSALLRLATRSCETGSGAVAWAGS